MPEKKCAAAALLVIFCGWCRGAGEFTVFTGSDVTFVANVSDRASEISWQKQDIKIIDLEQGKEPDFYPHYNIQDRVSASLEAKTFTLRNVVPADSGSYKAVLLINGKLQDEFFNLLVLASTDRVCNVSIRNMTKEHIVWLWCLCSSDGAAPSQYEWFNGSQSVSSQQNITVSMQKEPQILKCVASNRVSYSSATITVPRRRERRPHLALIPGVLVPIIIWLAALFTSWKKPEPGSDNQGPKTKAGSRNSVENGDETKNPKNRNVEGGQNPADDEATDM
ncbi:uncharacterized protein ACNLHF_008272 [Anomaloglossus baeobatrachus]|uniref:uncharacterized protein LOC142280667 isoform X1 n=1 Tax=Anomaloglossus baeobatrachus TaxID=238106 RepID=UPI003F507E52